MRLLHVIIVCRAESRVSRVEPERASTAGRHVRAQWQMEASRWLGFTTASVQQARFGLSFMDASLSPASLRDLLCLSHCGASSHEAAPLYCSASTRESACSRSWAAQAGGNLRATNTSLELNSLRVFKKETHINQAVQKQFMQGE